MNRSQLPMSPGWSCHVSKRCAIHGMHCPGDTLFFVKGTDRMTSSPLPTSRQIRAHIRAARAHQSGNGDKRSTGIPAGQPADGHTSVPGNGSKSVPSAMASQYRSAVPGTLEAGQPNRRSRSVERVPGAVPAGDILLRAFLRELELEVEVSEPRWPRWVSAQAAALLEEMP